MKCDACDSTEYITDCRAATSQVNVCETCFCGAHLHIAAKINTRKNEEIARLRAQIDAMKNCGNCAFGWDDYEGFTCYPPSGTDINWRMCSEDKSYRHWKFGKAVNAE